MWRSATQPTAMTMPPGARASRASFGRLVTMPCHAGWPHISTTAARNATTFVARDDGSLGRGWASITTRSPSRHPYELERKAHEDRAAEIRGLGDLFLR